MRVPAGVADDLTTHFAAWVFGVDLSHDAAPLAGFDGIGDRQAGFAFRRSAFRRSSVPTIGRLRHTISQSYSS